MLPIGLPRTDGLIFDLAYRAAEIEACVGGDWYDVFELPDGRIAISIGDVTGCGLDAALVISYVKEKVRMAAMEGPAAGEALAEANRGLITRGHRLIRAFLGYLDPLTLLLEYASAGHPAPLVVQADASVSALQLGDAILGAVWGETFHTMTEQLTENSALVLYTDGFIDHARNMDARDEQLRRVFADWAEAGFKSNANEIATRVLAPDPAVKDVAMLLIRLVPARRLDSMIPNTIASASRARAGIERVLKRAPFEGRNRDFILATAEAINNAIEHGSRSPEDRFHFSVEWDESGARSLVESFGQWRAPSQNFERGRGLMIMRALTDHMTLNVGKSGTTVRLYLDAETSTAGSPSPLAQ